MATTPQITDLTNGLKHLTQSMQSSGAKELKTSSATHQSYIAVVQTFQQTLQHQLPNIVALAAYGNPGTIPSATATKQNLSNATQAAHDTLHHFTNTYLEAFMTTVNAAFGQFEASDGA
jgi:hypothetical protein